MGNTSADWDSIHFDTAATPTHVLYCLLPGDRLVAGDNLDISSSTEGFYALSGLFLEPSFPRPVTDLALANPHVVSDGNPLPGQPEQVGHRNFSDFDTSGGGALEEEVHFYVRRIRRFHEVQTSISSNIELLKYVYEMRKGDFSSYDSSTRVFTAGTGTYGTATNVGDFDSPEVNIHAGDLLRVLDENRNLIDQAEIQVVTSNLTLTLRRPGLSEDLSSAVYFEVYLEQAIVPHEQSNEQLLGWITDEEILRRTVNYGSVDTDGGQASSFNLMQDSLILDWSSVGVQEGDYVVIDPAGPLYVDGESGVRPVGDTSVVGRTPYEGGPPSELDDNRGFYRVTSVGGTDLELDGASRFGGGEGDGTDDEIFGDVGSEYVVLPTVSGSVLTNTDPSFPYSGKEGQQALRPTAPPVSSSYKGRVGFDAYKSIQPFGYRIIRPSPIFSEDAIELVLFNRERMLSWIEEVKGVYQNGRGGDYYVFQRDDHIEDVGSPTDPTDGSGIVSNLVIESLQGLVSETPFANVSDCLSLLDRRFWILDTRLDAQGYSDFVGNTLNQRPVLPDMISEVLDLEDRFRDLRYSWISFRADRVDGSITSARRAENELPVELAKQQLLADQKKALEES